MRIQQFLILLLLAAAAALTPAEAAAGDKPGKVVDRFLDAYRAGDTQGMLALYGPEALFHDVSQRHTFQGTAQLTMFLGQVVAMHKEMDLIETRRVADGDLVVVEHVYKGVLSGAILGASLGKSGCPDIPYELPTTTWFQVKDGRIVSHKDFVDFATVQEIRDETTAKAGAAAH